MEHLETLVDPQKEPVLVVRYQRTKVSAVKDEALRHRVDGLNVFEKDQGLMVSDRG